MKTIYTMGIPAYHELEEMTFKYALYEGDEKIQSKEVFHDYKKPVLTGLYAIIMLMKAFPELKNQDLKVIVNDGALVEQISGTTMTKNKDVLKVAKLCRTHIEKFGGKLEVVSVAGDYEAKLEWEKKLK